MMRPFQEKGAGPVVIVGSDIPGLNAGLIEQAFRALASHDAVFGPARDGGYWLVGFARRRPIGRPFDDVRWSTAHALDDTLANLRPDLRVAFLPTLTDVDRPEDLNGLSSALGVV
jgi:glycosyltransferase A (GT-A) superfamily protein (DUF2064 family)